MNAAVLFVASGKLIYPRELDVPWLENFRGDIFHSALEAGRQLISKAKMLWYLAMACTAAQIVSAIVGQTNLKASCKLFIQNTWFSHQSTWLIPSG